MPWQCSACTSFNNDARSMCEMCLTKKPAAAAPAGGGARPPAPVVAPASGGGANWTCPSCTFAENKATDKLCALCNTARPAVAPIAAPKPTTVRPPLPTVQEAAIADLMAAFPGTARDYVASAYKQNGFSKNAAADWLNVNPAPGSKRALELKAQADAAALAKRKADAEAEARRKALDDAKKQAAAAVEAKRLADAAELKRAADAAAAAKAQAAAAALSKLKPAPTPTSASGSALATAKTGAAAATPKTGPGAAAAAAVAAGTPGSRASAASATPSSRIGSGTPSSASATPSSRATAASTVASNSKSSRTGPTPMDVVSPNGDRDSKRDADRKEVEAQVAAQKAALAQKERDMRKAAAEELRLARKKEEDEKRAAELKKQHDREAQQAAEHKEQKQKRAAQEAELKSVSAALDWVKGNYDITRFQELCTVLARVLTNLTTQPANPKYRVLNVSKPALNRAVARPLGGLLILRFLGFREVRLKASDPAPLPKGLPVPAAGAGAKKPAAADDVVMADPDAANKEVVYYVLDGAALPQGGALIRQELARVQQHLQALMTPVVKRYRALSDVKALGNNVEAVYFATVELRHILANVVTDPRDRNFRSVDTESAMFQALLKPVPVALDLLRDFGFRHSGKVTDPFWVVDNPDVNLMETAVKELSAELKALAPHTPIARAVSALVRNNSQLVAAQVIERLSAALGRVQANPHEQKYHAINLPKFFAPITKGGPPVDGATAFFALFGFQVDVVAGQARLPYPTPALQEVLRHRVADLNRAWQETLAALRVASA